MYDVWNLRYYSYHYWASAFRNAAGLRFTADSAAFCYWNKAEHKRNIYKSEENYKWEVYDWCDIEPFKLLLNIDRFLRIIVKLSSWTIWVFTLNWIRIIRTHIQRPLEPFIIVVSKFRHVIDRIMHPVWSKQLLFIFYINLGESFIKLVLCVWTFLIIVCND